MPIEPVDVDTPLVKVQSIELLKGSRLLLLAALSLFLFGCPSKRRPIPKWEVVELVTVEDQALELVQGAKTEFQATPDEEVYASQRLKVFWELYLSEVKGAEKDIFVLGEQELVFYRTPQFLFKIRHNPEQGGVRYKVECLPHRTTPESLEAAKLNSQNLARFLKEGALEVSLLKF